MLESSPIGSKLTGKYRGIVLKHCDNGKCKVFIPSVYDDNYMFNPDLLPDAELTVGVQDAGINGDGICSYPMIGLTVWCSFLNGDQNYPVIESAVLGGSISKNRYSNDQVLGTIDIVDKNAQYDYCSSKPLTWRRHCRSNEMMHRNGTLISGIQRNQFNKDCDMPRSEYSHSMYTLNYLRANVGAFSSAKCYFLYSTLDDLSLTTIDTLYVKEVLHFKSTADNNNNWFSDLDAYKSSTCLGILCKFASTLGDEDGFTTSVSDSLREYAKSNSRGLYHNYLRPVYSPRGSATGCKIAFVCLDNNYKWVKLFEKNEVNKKLASEIAKKDSCPEKIKLYKLLLVDLYICNGALYGFIPLYWDKHFAGSYPAMCPTAKIPPPVLADVAKYNINIILMDPILVESYDAKLNDGTLVKYLLDHESEFELRTTIKNGNETTSKFKLMCECYKAVQSEISAYHAYDKIDNFDTLECSEVTRKHEHVEGEMWDLTCSNILTIEKTERNIDALSSTWLAPDINTRSPYEDEYKTPDSGPKLKEYVIEHADHYLDKDVQLSNKVSHIIYSSGTPVQEVRQRDIRQSFYDFGYQYNEIVRLENNIETEYIKSNADRDGNLSSHTTTSIELLLKNPADENNWCHRLSKKDGNEDVDVTTRKSLTVLSPQDKANKTFYEFDKTGKIGIIATNLLTADVGNGNYTLLIDNAGNVLINAASQVKFVVGGSTVEINSGGTVNITADVTITGKLHVTADLTNDANITASGTITDSGCTLATHTHAAGTLIDHEAGPCSGTTDKGSG